jgi:hypothetical protein
VSGVVGKLLGKLLGKYQSERTEKGTRQVVLKLPNALTLAEVCGVMVENLRKRDFIDHVLILVDDVDLLDYQSDKPDAARMQRSLLAEALGELHFQPGIDVLLTARSWFYNASKDFQTLVNLSSSKLAPEDLIAIHDLQMKVYAGKSGIGQFLKSDALRAFAAEVDGLPGVFLQHLYTAFYDYQDEQDWGERDYDWFVGVFRRLFTNYRNKCAPAAERLEKAVQEGQLEML